MPPSVQFNLRISPEMRAELQAIAESNRRTVTDEINDRLRRSMDAEYSDHVHHETAESRALVTVMHQAMVTAGDIGIFTLSDGSFDDLGKGKWLDDPYTFERAVRAAMAILEGFRPKGMTSRKPEPVDSDLSPERVARKYLRIAGSDDHLDQSSEGVGRIDLLRRNLGRLRDRVSRERSENP